jgi:hypothetical protein
MSETSAAPAPAAVIDLSKIKAVVFDTFGTVVDWRSGVARDAAPFLARHGLSIAPEEFASAWRKRYHPSMEPIRAGKRPYTPIDVLHRENLVALRCSRRSRSNTARSSHSRTNPSAPPMRPNDKAH